MIYVCVCVCVSVCLFIWAITFECLDTKTSFLVWWYILPYIGQVGVPMSLGQGQGHFCQIGYFDYWTPNSFL